MLRVRLGLVDAGCVPAIVETAIRTSPFATMLLADHETSEYFVRVEARGRTVQQWQPRPGDPDNHFLDCSVGNLVAASLVGIRLPAAELPTRPAPPRRGKRKATAINF